jgi:hypothetical protein
MWDIAETGRRKLLLIDAVHFTGNAELYGKWMLRVVAEWKKSCEHHLSDTGSNRRAYIGHAAACMAIQSPEDITRKAWGCLTKRQQDEANHQADLAIEAWERANGHR